MESLLFCNLSPDLFSDNEIAFINEIDLEEISDDMAIRAI
jgi:hypothetical protein